jgi:peptidoglycan-N-acetylmuramic acid deacetylase
LKTVKALLILVAVLVLVYEVSNYLDSDNEPIMVSFDQEQPELGPELDEEIELIKEELETLDQEKEDEQDLAVVEKPNEPVKNTETQETLPVIPAQPLPEYGVDLETSGLSNEKQSWSFKRNSDHLPVLGYTKSDLSKYDAYYIRETDEKVIYLTFDEGYENGFTPAILDTLKENGVHAAFFVTLPYIRSNPELVIRMKEEGHLVANHSNTHKSFPTLSDEEVIKELQDTANYFEEITGYEMDPFFRPPMGEYSDRILYLTRKEGYKTIFWSIAYMDWDVNNQPGKDFVYNHFLENHHPGAIPLVHAVSSSNTEALDSVLKAMKNQGYRFGSLYELE